jgi:hypothetical protein
VIDLTRQFAPRFLTGPGNIAFQVKSVLSKRMLCRTKTLGGHTYVCPPCGSSCQVYNSCGDRHCPLCAGARRADWLEKTRELILPGVNYFQVVFTLPDRLSRLILGNRRALYGLLFRSAWQALRHELRQQGIEPAAVLVLHTWNQELGHHPHIHALVPGGGPSANPDNDPCWVVARDTSFPNRREPFLVDIEQLGRTFRDRFVRGLGTLLRKGNLRLPDEWSQLHDTRVRRDRLQVLRQSAWNVFISGPPHGRSDPEQVLKYVTRYLTGGPISDRRIVGQSQDQVTFLARSKDKSQGHPPIEHTIPGVEFLRRWSLHILPKGLTRCRRYGGYHGIRCARHLQTCRELLRLNEAEQETEQRSEQRSDEVPGEDHSPRCPRCQQPMVLLERIPRPSWRDVFQGSVTHPRLVHFPWLRPGPQTRQHPFEPDG